MWGGVSVADGGEEMGLVGMVVCRSFSYDRNSYTFLVRPNSQPILPSWSSTFFRNGNVCKAPRLGFAVHKYFTFSEVGLCWFFLVISWS